MKGEDGDGGMGMEGWRREGMKLVRDRWGGIGGGLGEGDEGVKDGGAKVWAGAAGSFSTLPPPPVLPGCTAAVLV